MFTPCVSYVGVCLSAPAVKPSPQLNDLLNLFTGRLFVCPLTLLTTFIYMHDYTFIATAAEAAGMLVCLC